MVEEGGREGRREIRREGERERENRGFPTLGLRIMYSAKGQLGKAYCRW